MKNHIKILRFLIVASALCGYAHAADQAASLRALYGELVTHCLQCEQEINHHRMPSKRKIALVLALEEDFGRDAQEYHEIEARAIISSFCSDAQYLLTHKAEIDALNESKKRDRALVEAARLKNLDLVKSLVEQGTNVDANRGEPLQHAVLRDHHGIAQCLLDHGANINARNDYGLTLLEIVARKHTNTAEMGLLLLHNPNIDINATSTGPNGRGDETTSVQSAALQGYAELVRWLLIRDATIPSLSSLIEAIISRQHQHEAFGRIAYLLQKYRDNPQVYFALKLPPVGLSKFPSEKPSSMDTSDENVQKYLIKRLHESYRDFQYGNPEQLEKFLYEITQQNNSALMPFIKSQFKDEKRFNALVNFIRLTTSAR